MRSPDAAKPAGAVPGGKGGGQPQLHHGRLPRLLAPLLRLDAARPPPGKDDQRNKVYKRGIKILKSCTPGDAIHIEENSLPLYSFVRSFFSCLIW